MPRGVPLTPEQVELIGEVYARTGNASEAARVAGVSTNSADRVVQRLREGKRGELYARALDRSLRDARRWLSRGQRLAAQLLDRERTDGSGMEPQHIAAFLNALARSTDSIAGLKATREKVRSGRLTRGKTRLELELLRLQVEQARKAAETGDGAPLLEPEDVAALVARHFGGA